jgi:hypothetical protein
VGEIWLWADADFRKIMGFISADDPHGKIEANNYKNLQTDHQST